MLPHFGPRGVPGDGDIEGDPDSRRGVSSLSEPGDFEPL